MNDLQILAFVVLPMAVVALARGAVVLNERAVASHDGADE